MRTSANDVMAQLRVPPNSNEAERAVLGAVMLDNSCFDAVAAMVEPRDFYAAKHVRVYETMHACSKIGNAMDVVTIGDILKASGLIEGVGGYAYLNSLLDAVPTAANVAHYARIVVDKSRLRDIIGVATEAVAAAFAEPEDTDEFVQGFEGAASKLSQRRLATDEPEAMTVGTHRVMGAINAAYERGDGVTGTPTGFRRLDALTAGLHPGTVTILAARPGMGKTAFAMNIMHNTAEITGGAAIMFSLEMIKDDLIMRQLASEARIDSFRLRNGRVRRDEWVGLTHAASRIARLPIYIDDVSDTTILDIRAKARRIVAGLPPGVPLRLIGIDYMQLMKPVKRSDSRERDVADMSRGVKALAKELRVPVLALSQLNRKVEDRPGDKRPQLADLRESGALEQDADLVMFIYRDWVYNKNTEAPNVAEILIRKNRHGPTGDVKLAFMSEFTRFDNLADEHGAGDQTPPPHTDDDFIDGRRAAAGDR